MTLAVDREVRGQVASEKRLHLIVGRPLLDETVPEQDAFGVGIDHEHGVVEPIAEDGVGGLLADPVNCEKGLSEAIGRLSAHPNPVAAPLPDKPAGDALQALGFDVEMADGPEMTRQPVAAETGDSPQIAPETCAVEIGQSALDVRPARVLRQHRADDHVGGIVAARPPVRSPPLGIEGLREGSNERAGSHSARRLSASA
jgi:hypothetical protein